MIHVNENFTLEIMNLEAELFLTLVPCCNEISKGRAADA